MYSSNILSIISYSCTQYIYWLRIKTGLKGYSYHRIPFSFEGYTVRVRIFMRTYSINQSTLF